MPLGDLVRSVHFWMAQIVTVTVLLHMLRVFFTGSHKRPREINWYAGLGLLAITLGFVFTGSMLKFDQEGLEALQHNKKESENNAESLVTSAFAPDGVTLYVTLNGEDAVAAVDLATQSVTGKVTVGNRPVQIYVIPDASTVVVANQGTEESPSTTLPIVDAATLTEVGTA